MTFVSLAFCLILQNPATPTKAIVKEVVLPIPVEKDPGQFVNCAADPAYAAKLAEYSSKMLDWRLGFADRTLTGYRATPNGLEVRAA